MAEKKRAASKTTASAKKAEPKKTTTTRKKPNEAEKKKRFGDSIYDEIIMILCVLVSVLVMLSLFTDVMGIFGVAMNTFLKGVFGAGAFLLPIFVIIFCIWALISKERKFAYGKIFGIVVLMISVPALFHLITEGGLPKYADGTFLNLVKYFFKDGTSLNGGVVGGITSWGLYSAIGKGSYLALAVLIVIGIMLTTGKSLFAAIIAFFGAIKQRRKVKEAKIKAKAESIKEKEAKRAKKEEEAELKRQQKLAEIPPLKMKKGNFNITINGDEGLDNSLPALDTVVFEKKKEEPPKAEEIKEVYDFKRDAEKDWNYKEDKFIEVVGVVEENTDEDDIVFEMPERTEEKANEIIPDVIERTFDADSIEFGGAEDGKLLEGVLGEEEGFDSESIKKEIKNMPKAEAIEFADDDEEYEKYEFPPIDLLGKAPYSSTGENKKEMLDNAKKLEDTLHSFGVEAKVVQINKGPTVTRYELTPSQGVKVSKIVNLADDLALNLAATGIRIEAPIPGKAAVGIEVPNKESQSVYLRSVIESDAFKKAASKVTFALGQDIAGNPVVTDIAKMPHLLIAGATGSGKSVCINTLITSILYKADPEEVKLILIDPKVVELSVYNGIPHLLIPVVTDPKKAAGSLNWAVREMLGRYQLFAEHNVRDIKGYNEMKREKDETDLMPQIVIVIDELADLMMAAPGDVEDSICRLAQMARAAGIHLIIATQRPSVDVITGLIKANIPSRLAFAVSSGIDSRTILDTVGAEKLLGKGDMLFYPVGMSKPVRLQGAFVTDKEVEQIVEYVKKDNKARYSSAVMESITSGGVAGSEDSGEERDEHFDKAVDLVVEKEKASVSMLQRQFRIGYNRAARLMDSLEEAGIVGPEEGSKPRRVLVTRADVMEMRKPKSEG